MLARDFLSSNVEMDKSKIIEKIRKLLDVEEDINFLTKLTIEELEKLIAYIRARIDNPPKRKI